LDLDVWKETSNQLHLRVDKAEKEALSRLSDVQLKTIVDDVQRLLDSEQRAPNARGLQAADWFAAYHTLDDIYSWFDQLAAQYADTVSKPTPIGQTTEKRSILQLRITAPGDASNRKRIWLEGLMHAREWISGTTIQYIADSLAQGYASGDARVKALLEKVVFVIVPVCNPDGYVYSWNNNRLWRKNREYTRNGRVYGVDLNRNWPDHWGGSGGSSSPSSETYRGPSAASSLEVKALIDAYVKEPNVVGAIDLHSYSQLVLRPYGWTTSSPPDEANLSRVGQQIASDIRSQSGKTYISQHSADLYLASGNVVDWWYGAAVDAKKKAGIPAPRPYAYCIELRPSDDDSQGFVLPPSEIIPTGQEIYAATLHFAEEAA
ncbi:hypothetical protein THASP1DRAFT_5631, partial [Thamnocephalis sphaerospora]